MIKERKLSHAVRMICVAGLAMSSQAVLAQETVSANTVQKVQITGSRLLSPNADSPTPLQVLTSADIAASGAVNLQDLLQKNPTMGTPGLSRTNSNFLTSGGGVSTVNLRNLGESRTLVLVNGRRFVSGVPGDTAVDLNTIPIDFIERVELMTGGASATYGSDAVAGVVNIILKRNFEGVTVDASVGRSSRSDDSKKKLAITFGTTSSDGASNIMGHFGYSKQGSVMSKDRPGLGAAVDQYSLAEAVTGDVRDIFKTISPYYSSFAPQGRFFYGNAANGPAGNYTYDRNGNPIPFDTNGNNGAATGFNRSEYRTIAVPTERFLFATNGTLKLNDNNNAFFEGTYAQTKVDTNIEPFALDSSNVYRPDGIVPGESLIGGVKIRNPLIPDYLWNRMTDTNGDGLRDYRFTRRLTEFGPRHSSVNRGTLRLATGVKGVLPFTNDWNYDAFVSYGRTTESQNSTGQVNIMSLRNSLAGVPNGSGGVMCADVQARTDGCVPINMFGFGTITPEALKYVTAPGSLETAITQKIAGANVGGDLPWGLPAGNIGLSAGFEWRSEDSSSVPDPLTQAGLNAGNATPPTYGKFNVREVYAETRIPLLKDVVLAKNLDFRGSFRHGDYSTVGSTNSWNAGLEWAPVSSLKFRGTRAVSTRAPNINELYQPPSQDFPSVSDPCEGITATGSDPISVACRAAPGVAANLAANGGVFTLNQADKQGVSGYNRGNPNLGAEQGRSSTIGVVVTPTMIPMLSKFTFTADYFNIKISEAIVSTPRQFSLAQCYGGGNPVYCALITRRATAEGSNSPGSIKYSDTAVTNSGGYGTKGIDLTASWADRVGPGRLSAKVAYTYLKTLWAVPLPGEAEDESAGEVESPRNKAVLNLAYKWGDFGINSTTSYTGRAGLDDQFLNTYEDPQLAPKIGSYTTTDFQLTYDVKKNYQVYFGMDNAFDKKAPPIVTGLPGNTTGTETNASAYDPIGRRYYLGLRVTL
ncbi:TonB-dependent receptor [Duganella sp. Leaf61]|uniref:TonB-dependent receptor domain-containing protein n=1 Tax=Duganella sp. Leaf61 TaxID=1736227 RepID=UPI0006F31524|nr:TonB-dependent receptor [Duganella sp. Leaf61]KQN79071.1 TonB-dependent receptor [Duganella sp. Leaf61]